VNKQQLDTQRALVAQLEALVKFDQAAIDNARAILSYTDIIAPIAGRTGIRQVDEGNIVHSSDATGVVVITQIKPINVLFNLPQQELPKLAKGMEEAPLPIVALGPSGRAVDRGKVQVIDNQVDQTTGTVKLKAEFPNAKLQLWPGQFVNVRLLIETLRQVVVVPTAAIQRGPSDATYVYVVRSENTVTVRNVTVKLQDDQQAAIEDGLRAGEIVVTSGFVRLRDGQAVTVSNPEGGGETEPGKKGKGKGKGKGKEQQGIRIQTSGD
jgi:multidrug efflux system membrane fusion protein